MTYIMMIVVPLQVLTEKSLSLRLVLGSEGLYVSTTNACVPSTLQPSTSASNWGETGGEDGSGTGESS